MLKSGLHIVITIAITIAEHTFDDASRRILKLSTYQLQTLFVKDQYLCSLRADFKHFQVGKVCALALRISYSFQFLVTFPIDISTNQEWIQKSWNIVSQLQD